MRGIVLAPRCGMGRPLVFAHMVAWLACFASTSVAEEASTPRDEGWDAHRHQLAAGVGAGFTYSVRASNIPGLTLDYAYGGRHVDVGTQLRFWGGLPVISAVAAPGIALHFHSHATDALPVEFRANWGLGGLFAWDPTASRVFAGWQTSLGASVRWWVTQRVGIELGPEGQLGKTNGQVRGSDDGSTAPVDFIGVCGWASAVYTL